MAKKKALITGPPVRRDAVEDLERLGMDVVNGTDAALERLSVPKSQRSRDLSEGEMATLIVDAAIYVYGGLEAASAHVLERAADLKLIAFLGTGWSDEGCVDAAAAQKFKIPVSNTPGANAASVAEITLGLILALQRRIVDLSNCTKRGEGRPIKLRDIAGRCLGIVGLGQIGSRVARHAVRGFGMKVVYSGPHPKPDLEAELGLRRVELDELLRMSDFVTLHCPARTTAGLIGQREISLIQPSAYLINVSSPEVVSGPAIVDALEAGRISGAAFDGWYKEPVELQKRFLGLDDSKLIVMPRTAWLTEDSYDRMVAIAMDNIRARLRGDRPPNQVNL